MNSKNFCIIMAGGVGARFWPLSRTSLPKQFLDIMGTGRSFIRATFERFSPMIPVENFLVVTSEKYCSLVLEHIPELNPSQVLCEPLRRNTAPCMAYASYKILKQCPDANIVVTPADHLVLDNIEFSRVVAQGLEFIDGNEKLLTIGISPTRAETGYGYIQHNCITCNEGIMQVKTFTEKPNKELAEAFVKSGDFLWNSGIFIWSLKAIIYALEKYLPQIARNFERGMPYYSTPEEKDFIEQLYPECENISIDYGVMEKADDVYVSIGNFGWSDIGTWGSIYQNTQNKDADENCIIDGGAITYNTKGSIISVPKGKIAVVEGLEDYLVVDQEDVLLITKLSNEQNIRNYVDDVNTRLGEEYV